MRSYMETWKERALSRRMFLRTTAGAAGAMGAGLLLPERAWADGMRSTSPVVDFNDHSIIFPGFSTLVRRRNRVHIHLRTSELTHGEAYTFWMGVFSDPDADVYGGRLTGFVVNRHGGAEVVEFQDVGEIVGEPPIPDHEGTLTSQDALHGRIVVVVRNHGPADLERLFEQTQTFEPGVAVDARISIHDFR